MYNRMLNQMFSFCFYIIQKAQLFYCYSVPDIMKEEVNCCACQAAQDIALARPGAALSNENHSMCLVARPCEVFL